MINLLPLETKQKLRRLYGMRTLTVSLFAATGLLMVMVALALPSYFTLLYGQGGEHLAESADTQAIEDSFMRAEATVREINAKGKLLLPEGRKQTLAPTEALLHIDRAFMDQATTTLRHRIVLQSLNYELSEASKDAKEETTKLSLSGIARDRESLRRFVSALKADPDLKQVDAPVSNFLSESELPFVLHLTFRTP